MNTKEHLRSNALARRDALPEIARTGKSKTICDQLEIELSTALEDRNAAPAIGVFASMRSEVDLQPFIDAAYRREWNVYFPCMVRDAADEPSRMEFYGVSHEQLDAAQVGFLGTPMRCMPCAALEVDGYAPLAPEKLDAVVVPLVAFDNDGNRLGYGGGNYDRLLPRLRKDAVVVGVAFEEQRVDAVPVEPHDRPLPLIVSA